LSGDNFEADRSQTITCEALGCTANATHKIAVNVGTLGVIFVSVCSNCAPIFQEPVARYESEQSEDQSLESKNKEQKVLGHVGQPGLTPFRGINFNEL
jgi:hypothetical protein